jgi:hypothetical protein
LDEVKEVTGSAQYIRGECLVLCKENRALLAENERLEDLVELTMDTNGRGNGVIRQYQSALMHYNVELQSRSAGVEAIHLKPEQRAADEVARAGFRQKPGPKNGSIQKHVSKISRRGKTNHSDWKTQEDCASKSLNPMAPPRELKKDEKIIYQRQWSCKFASS